ncbi:hypothetical protein B484DRAFT_398222 [Ochromonadaceae sp. CCMP2298]|nr:hypothetical protein B484DRAFT_398222 [Ochromonadaceae sp. CCMP2298]
MPVSLAAAGVGVGMACKALLKARDKEDTSSAVDNEDEDDILPPLSQKDAAPHHYEPRPLLAMRSAPNMKRLRREKENHSDEQLPQKKKARLHENAPKATEVAHKDQSLPAAAQAAASILAAANMVDGKSITINFNF